MVGKVLNLHSPVLSTLLTQWSLPTPWPQGVRTENLGGESLDWGLGGLQRHQELFVILAHGHQGQTEGCVIIGGGVPESQHPPHHPFSSPRSTLLGAVTLNLGSLWRLGSRCSEVWVCVSQELDFTTPGLGFQGN